MRRRLVLASAGACLAFAALTQSIQAVPAKPGLAAATAAPAPLSAQRTAPDVASSFGSDSFGRWTVDGCDLPAYRCQVDEQVAPRARQPGPLIGRSPGAER